MPAALKLADLLRGALALGLVAALAVGGAKAAFILGAGLAAAVLVRLALLPALYDLAVVAAIALQCAGEALGVYDLWSGFDTLVHVTLPALTAPAAYLALARLEVVRDLRDPAHGLAGRGDVGVWVLTLALGGALGAIWELVEGLSDQLTGSGLQESVGDTNRDLLADTCGAALGAFGLVLWSRRGPGSVKRVAGSHEELTDA